VSNNLPLITIITVVYNGASSIEQTIHSVTNYQYPYINFVVIDGGSTDGTVEIIRKYESKLTYWISEPDGGIYDAMNKGWEKADINSYILYLGSGDKLIRLPDMEKFKNADVIYGNVMLGGKQFNSSVGFKLRLGNTIHHQALLVKKSIHPAPPFLLEYRVFADFDFNQRLYKSGISFIKDLSFSAYALEGGISSMTSKKEMLKVVNKNFGKFYKLLAGIYYFLQDVRTA
jgi:glycosyltransferase involved in cell wall biosynthesis